MDADAITREPLERYSRSPKGLDDQKKCIWAVAMRLMQAGDPDASAHVSMVGQRIGLREREIQSAITNAAKRTGWEAPRHSRVSASIVSTDTREPEPDIREPGESADAWAGPGWRERNRPERCERPERCGAHASPDSYWYCEHPECPECAAYAEWPATHELDLWWGYYICTEDTEIDPVNGLRVARSGE